MMTDEELFRRLAEVTGQILDQPELLAEWTRDWWPIAARLAINEETLPAFAVVPESVEEVAAVVKIAAEAGRIVITKGGGSGLVGALEPRAGAILIDTRGLNVIEAVDPLNETVRVDAGVHGGELEIRLNEQGYTLAHDPESLHLSTVGGWVSTRASGHFSTKYGGIEDLIAAIDVVLPDGTVARSRPIPRHGAGPRWWELFIGAEGALGIITGATLRVRPLPEEIRFRALGMPSYEVGLEAIRALLQRGIVPAAIRLYDANATADFAEHTHHINAENLLVLVFDGPPEIVEVEERLALGALVSAGGRDLGAEPAIAWFDSRHAIDWIIDGNEAEGAIADLIDVCAPWAVLPRVIAAGRAALHQRVAETRHHSTHFYRGGAEVSFVFFVREESDEQAMEVYRRAYAAVMRAILDAGGSIVHHSGIGQARLPWVQEEIGEGMPFLQAIKRAVDPDNRFNPGRFGG
jgi:alkyldihydroxyacetonephosphate synthase